MPFHLHRSNRTEELVEALARVVAERLPDPFARERIVVQGKGMERWLSMELARRLGIWANPAFPFPRRLIEEAMAGDEAAAARAAAWEPEALLWSIARLLRERAAEPAFRPLRDYLADDPRGVKRVQLAGRIAATFDHYVVYRPDLLRQWQGGAPDDWQAILWRHLLERHGPHHFAARAESLAAAPFARVSLFGLSTLPPLYVDLLRRLAESTEVHLFLLSPSREYWGAIRARSTLLKEALARDGHLPSEAELLAGEGHPLLASLGRLGREFQEVLESSLDYLEDDDLYRDPGEGSMLAALQSDILALRQRGPAERLAIAPGDASIRVHLCHGPLREIEVLHDRLLALFDDDPTLEARDVIVMTPSIDAYAPYVEAVFRAAGDAPARIPYRIADRSPRAVEEIGDAFFRVLDVLQGRFGASEVLDLLTLEPVRQRFRIAADDLELLREWVVASGIRWGADAEHRAEEGQPPLAENTWRFGLDRLLLGYALAADGGALPFGVLPHDEVEGGDAAVLGRLAELCRVLFHWRRRLSEPRPPAAWRDDLCALLADTLALTNQNAFQHQRLRAALAALAERAADAGFDDALHLDAARAPLEDELRAAASAQGFLSGGVTFCELVPMRTIPFRVVCLVGMNDGAFPRQRRPLTFDRIAAEPRAGDRSVREDDRYLFLEALLSARQALLITCAGQSIADNSPLPPSVVVSELLDALDRTFIGDDERAARERVVVRHPLQPFSPRNFGARASERFSFSLPHHQGAQALAAAARSSRAAPLTPPFLAAPLPPLEGGEAEDGADRLAAPRALSVDQLVRFFEHPTRAFLQTRLGLYLGRDLPPIDDREPLLLDALEEWGVGDDLLRRCAGPDELAAAAERQRARGVLPPGALGDTTFARIRAEALPLLAQREILCRGERHPVEIDLIVAGTRIEGVLRDVWPESGLVQAQYSRLGKRRDLGLWIRHLLLQLAAPTGVARTGHLIGRPPKNSSDPPVLRFRPLDHAEALLAEIVRLYWLGLRWPLPLFERASRAYADALHADPEAEEDAMARAARAFDGGELPRGEDRHDDHVRQVYGADVTFAEMERVQRQQQLVPCFGPLARALLLPMLAHREGTS